MDTVALKYERFHDNGENLTCDWIALRNEALRALNWLASASPEAGGVDGAAVGDAETVDLAALRVGGVERSITWRVQRDDFPSFCRKCTHSNTLIESRHHAHAFRINKEFGASM